MSLAKIWGSNREYIIRVIPHISKLIKSRGQDVVEKSDVIVVSNKDEEINKLVNSINNNKMMF